MKTTLRILPLMLGIMLFFTQCEKEADLNRPVNAEAFMNLKSNDACSVTQTLWAGAGQNDTLKGINVGSVTATVVGSTLVVEYSVEAPWFLTETHLWVGKKISDIPRQAAPGRFLFKANLDFESGWTQNVDLASLGIKPGDPIYVAAHGVVVDGVDGVEGLETILPLTATFSAVSGAPDSYLSVTVSNAKILDGVHNGWCLNPFIIIGTGNVYNNADVFTISNLPADHNLLGGLENPENIELVNYIINNISVGDVYTYTDIQQAIWELLFEEADLSDATATLAPTPNPEKVEMIKSNALENGFGFLPQCFEKVAIILFKDNIQPVVIEYPVPCGGGSETVWAFGGDTFIDKNIASKWGWIFEVTCD